MRPADRLGQRWYNLADKPRPLDRRPSYSPAERGDAEPAHRRQIWRGIHVQESRGGPSDPPAGASRPEPDDKANGAAVFPAGLVHWSLIADL